jgi:sugar-specific transcriptional regulator TrmB
MQLEKALSSLGLQKNTASVYLALLKRGSSKAGALIQDTKLHRMLVYNALEELQERGLATATHSKSGRMFDAADPAVLLREAQKVREIAEGIVPELNALRKKDSDLGFSIRTFVGKEGFRENLEEVIESAARQKTKEIRILGGGRDIDFYDAIEDWYASYTKLLKKKGVKKRLLAPASYSSEFKKRFSAEKNTELRVLGNGLSSPSYTRITNELVSIEIYRPKLVVIQIRSEAIAKSYIDFFELLWKGSKN